MSRLSKRAQWHKRVLAFERSGLTRKAWCAQAGVAVATLDYWRSRLRNGGDGSVQALVPIVVSDAPVDGARCSGAGTGVLEIEVGGGGVRLRANARVDAQWLASVLRGLR
jgi:hypothetical protein